MAGIRRGYEDPEKHWLKMKNTWARDSAIDWGALGVLAYLTSHKDGFEVALQELTSSRKSKRHKVDGWIEELEKRGYIRREIRRDGGVIVGTTWHLLDPDVDSQH